MLLTTCEIQFDYLTLVSHCWVCKGERLKKYSEDRFYFFKDYWLHDLELTSLNGKSFWLMRCQDCGFIQPNGLPNIENYFDRIYTQAWSEEYYTVELELSGFINIQIKAGAPELFLRDHRVHLWTNPKNWFRLAMFYGARFVLGGVHSPLAMNLQAFGMNPL